MEENRECNAPIEGLRQIPAPDLPYLPRDPKRYAPNIGFIGCGGIAPSHLKAYRRAGYRVVALCDCDPPRAQAMRDAFFPDASVFADHRDVLDRKDIAVVDVATHPEVRAAIVEDALLAEKHVLSQKPFVTDLARGRRLVELADRKGLRLAVNQNGRWAPHFSYMRHAVAKGLIGDVVAVHLAVHWNHEWTAGTSFDSIRHLILYDFAIHWFDMVCCIMGEKAARRVYASMAPAPTQRSTPPLLGQALIEYDEGQASVAFDGMTRVGALDHSVIVGASGMLVSSGPDLNHQTVSLTTAEGQAVPQLEGEWFTNGFHGTMAELLCAIEEGRTPSNDARRNLRSLALCFAAAASAEEGKPKIPGEVEEISLTPLHK